MTRIMGGWFRLYNDAVDDPKIQRIEPSLFRSWVNLLCLASKNGGRIPTDEVGFRLRMSEHDALATISALVAAELLEYLTINGDRFLSPHNWAMRQPNRDSSKIRMRKMRARKKAENQTTETDVTRHVTTCDALGDGNVPTSTSTLSIYGEKSPIHGSKISTDGKTTLRNGGRS